MLYVYLIFYEFKENLFIVIILLEGVVRVWELLKENFRFKLYVKIKSIYFVENN